MPMVLASSFADAGNATSSAISSGRPSQQSFVLYCIFHYEEFGPTSSTGFSLGMEGGQA